MIENTKSQDIEAGVISGGLLSGMLCSAFCMAATPLVAPIVVTGLAIGGIVSFVVAAAATGAYLADEEDHKIRLGLPLGR